MRNKLIIFSFFFLNSGLLIQAQNQVGIGTTTPDASAVLEIESTTKGVRFPRMNTNRRNNISSPAQGLIVYDNNTDSFWYHNGSGWVQISTVTSAKDGIGDSDGDTRIITEFSNNNNQIRFYVDTLETFRFRNSRIEQQDGSQGVHYGINAGQNDDLSRNRNVYIGTNSGRNGTTANINVGVGYFSLDSSITANAMLAIGQYSLARSSSNRRCVGIGDSALFQNRTANNNLAIGKAAMKNHTTRTNNTALGKNSLLSSVNVANAVAIGNNSLRSNVSNTNQVAVGNSAGEKATSGSNIFIGNQAGGLHTTGGGRLYIDNSNTSNPLLYGNLGADSLILNGNLHVSSNIYYVGDLLDISDRRLKEDIQLMKDFKGRIGELKLYSFSMKSEQTNSSKEYGFIAQEVETIFPELVRKSNEGFLSVSYSEFIPISVESIKASNNDLQDQGNRIEKLLENIEELEKLLD